MHASGYTPLKYLELATSVYALLLPTIFSRTRLTSAEGRERGNKQQRRTGKLEALERNIKTEVK